jgi:hypothetical protein
MSSKGCVLGSTNDTSQHKGITYSNFASKKCTSQEMITLPFHNQTFYHELIVLITAVLSCITDKLNENALQTVAMSQLG